MKKTAIICTTFNEEKTITVLLESLLSQTLKADEIIICDGGSSDDTQKIVSKFINDHEKFKIKLLVQKGNRSVGRNAAITESTFDLIAITDAGCIPDKKWLEELVKKHTISGAPVIAGFYKGLPQTSFEEAVVPYALVMPNKINEKTFLPSTRSMLIEKKVWSALGGFDERLSLNEDYPFAKKIRESGFAIVFAKNAVVGWIPRKNIGDFSTMITRFAQGDVEAGIIRPKVLILFCRYTLLLFLTLSMLFFSTPIKLLALLVTLFVLYTIWSIQKNIQYVSHGWYWLPLLQYVADFSVIKGSTKGMSSRLFSRS